MRVCATPGCGTLVPTTAYRHLCPSCARTRDQARGTREDRGYGTTHQTTRTMWQHRIDAGETVNCWRCGQPIDGEWHLGHDDHDRSITHGPEHALCNLQAAGRQG